MENGYIKTQSGTAGKCYKAANIPGVLAAGECARPHLSSMQSRVQVPVVWQLKTPKRYLVINSLIFLLGEKPN
jgi:hypothetical protein